MAIYSMAGEKLSYSKDLKGHVRKNVFSTFFSFFFNTGLSASGVICS